MTHRFALVLLLLVPWAASAAGLGRITVLSILGEPLNAEIDVDAASASEQASLAAKLASRDEYERAQLAPIPPPDTMRAEIERTPDGRPVVRLRSNQPIDKPLVNLLVDLSFAGGSATRRYSFLVDSIDRRGPRVAVAPAAKERAAAPSPAHDVPAHAPARRTYTVQRGETIYSVARATRHDGVTVAQMVVAIYRANGDAFTAGNIHRLQAGRTLTIPDRNAASAITVAEARQLLAAQRAARD